MTLETQDIVGYYSCSRCDSKFLLVGHNRIGDIVIYCWECGITCKIFKRIDDVH